MAAFVRLFSVPSPINLASKLISQGVNNFFREPACTSGILINYVQIRERAKYKRRTTQPPTYWTQRRRKFIHENLTDSNRDFVRGATLEKYEGESPLKEAPWPRGEWTPESQRTGVITRKIGIYPMWKKDGKRILATLLQVVDNHVIRYISPEVYATQTKHPERFKGKYGAIVVGAERTDPLKYTQNYIGLFNESGVMPKKKLTRFIVSPDAAIQPGTPLFASHFRVGQHVDVYGKTIGHGFQGVVKRWGFKGGPKTHGCTKFHRRPGNIGTGRQMARVWPGKHLPGHMGQERRKLRCQRIIRINTKYNVLFIEGPATPGHVHSYVYVMDARSKHARPENPVFPTHYPDEGEPLPEDLFADDIHNMDEGTITFADAPEIVMPVKSKKIRR